ncbi:MAG: hypothetical protein OIF38_10235 [Cellvibrionaceae bacterium]|nr:hypothetical protein [Cellvibrionaceae bacterium]
MLLRKQIEAITKAHPTTEQPHYFETLKQYNAHNIHPVEDPWPQWQYTCLMLVFGLVDSKPYRHIASRYEDVYAGPEFVQYLRNEGLLQTCKRPQVGGIVLYRQQRGADKPISHAAIVEPSGHFLSKWGTGGLWLHGLYDLPASYGKYAEFFEPLDPALAFNGFLRFARAMGADDARPRIAIQEEVSA